MVGKGLTSDMSYNAVCITVWLTSRGRKWQHYFSVPRHPTVCQRRVQNPQHGGRDPTMEQRQDGGQCHF